MARLCFLAVCIIIYSSALLVSAQDCSLPSKAELEAALPPLLVISDGNQMYSPNVTEGSVQYVCLAQGDMIDTYKEASLVATFTPNSGVAEQTRIFDIECGSGTWSGRTGSLDPVPNDVVAGAPPNTNCYRCREGFNEGGRRCRACDGTCNSGLMRCTGPEDIHCCLSFAANGQCNPTTNCSSSGPNYVATESNDFTCSCNLTCPDGFTANSDCTDCDLVSICNASNPCMNGQCIQNSPADNYTCDCTAGYEGVNCTVMVSSTPSPTPSSTPVPSSTPSPSPTPLCTIANCASCQNSSCCKTCASGSYLTSGCTCGPCTVRNCLRCELLNSRCCVACADGYELVNDCECEQPMSSSVKPPAPTVTTEGPSRNTGFSTGTLVGLIIGTILGILLLITLAAVIAYVIYYVAVGRGAAVSKAKPKSPFANGESHNNPLYLAPDDVAGEVAD